MLVSVIVPSYQQGIFIEDAIKSLLEQKNERVEIIVYDSLSKDNTSEVLLKFSDKIKLVFEADLGQAHAINKGLRECKGDIICYLNSDDILLPNALEVVINCFEKDKNLDLLYGKAYYIDRAGAVVGEYKTSAWNSDRFFGECFVCQPAAFWSRRIMEKIGYLDQSLHCSMDYDYWLRIVQGGGVVKHIDDYLACSRDYPQTKTRELRGRVFIENINISLKRLGYVHWFWISQYMDYFKYEKRPFWAMAIPGSGRFRNWVTAILQRLSRVWARDVYLTEKSGGPIL